MGGEAGGYGTGNDPPPVELETSSESVVPQLLVLKIQIYADIKLYNRSEHIDIR